MRARAEKQRRLKVAVAQMSSLDGDIAGNLQQATHLAELASAQGAQLILFPEFMPTGYVLNESLWAAGEPSRGQTVTWLMATSKRLRCWIGTSFLEAQGEDFFDTFVLTGPDGQDAGRVRKETPASQEVPFFTGESNPHTIDVPFGRVGVGICYESYLCRLERQFAAARPDLILLPHSFPGFAASGPYASPPGTHVAGWYARRFGVPVLMTNKVGAYTTPTPGGGTATGRFPGASAIVDSSGEVLAVMNDQPGVAVADVLLDPARKAVPRSAPSCRNNGISDLAVPFGPPRDAADAFNNPGVPSYSANPNRARAARAISSTPP